MQQPNKYDYRKVAGLDDEEYWEEYWDVDRAVAKRIKVINVAK